MSGKITTGTRAQVWHGTARHTSGGLTKNDLMKNKAGRIVSRKKHHSAKKDNRLVKAGYKTKKGSFGFVKMGSRKRGRKGHRGGSGMAPLSAQLWGSGSAQDRALQAGGAPYGDNVTPANFSAGNNNDSGSSILGNGIAGAGITNFGNSSIGVQMRAGMTGGSTYGPAPRPPGPAPRMGATMGGKRGKKGKRGKRMYGGILGPVTGPTIASPAIASVMGGKRGGTTSHGYGNLGADDLQVKATMYGGTTSQRFQLSPGSVGVQEIAGNAA